MYFIWFLMYFKRVYGYFKWVPISNMKWVLTPTVLIFTPFQLHFSPFGPPISTELFSEIFMILKFGRYINEPPCPVQCSHCQSDKPKFDKWGFNTVFLCNSRGAGRSPAPHSRCTGTRCLQGLVQGVTGFGKVEVGTGTRCDRVWYKVRQSLVQGVTKSGTRCDKVRYKV